MTPGGPGTFGLPQRTLLSGYDAKSSSCWAPGRWPGWLQVHAGCELHDGYSGTAGGAGPSFDQLGVNNSLSPQSRLSKGNEARKLVQREGALVILQPYVVHTTGCLSVQLKPCQLSVGSQVLGHRELCS